MPISDFSIAIDANEGFRKNDIFAHKFFGERLGNQSWSKFLTELLTTGTSNDMHSAFGMYFHNDVNKSIAENYLNWESPNTR